MNQLDILGSHNRPVSSSFRATIPASSASRSFFVHFKVFFIFKQQGDLIQNLQNYNIMNPILEQV